MFKILSPRYLVVNFKEFNISLLVYKTSNSMKVKNSVLNFK